MNGLDEESIGKPLIPVNLRHPSTSAMMLSPMKVWLTSRALNQRNYHPAGPSIKSTACYIHLPIQTKRKFASQSTSCPISHPRGNAPVVRIWHLPVVQRIKSPEPDPCRAIRHGGRAGMRLARPGNFPVNLEPIEVRNQSLRLAGKI